MCLWVIYSVNVYQRIWVIFYDSTLDYILIVPKICIGGKNYKIWMTANWDHFINRVGDPCIYFKMEMGQKTKNSGRENWSAKSASEYGVSKSLLRTNTCSLLRVSLIIQHFHEAIEPKQSSNPADYIDVGDECWRQNILVTSLRCWWRFWSLTSSME